MNKSKFIGLTFLSVFFILCLSFFSCENEQSNLSENKSEKQLLSKTSIDFLNTKMSNFNVQEINGVGSEYFFAKVNTTNAAGYLITDKVQKNIIAYINFDIVNKTTTIYDYVKNEVAFSDNLTLFDDVDFNGFVQNINSQDSARRFWGWECRSEHEVGGQCYRFCEYFILGISNGGSSYPCDDLPGSNPKLLDVDP